MVSAKGLNRKDLLNIGVRNPKLDHSVFQNLLLSGIHESLHNNSVDLTEIFKLVGNPKPDHSVLPKHERKNGGMYVCMYFILSYQQIKYYMLVRARITCVTVH